MSIGGSNPNQYYSDGSSVALHAYMYIYMYMHLIHVHVTYTCTACVYTYEFLPSLVVVTHVVHRIKFLHLSSCSQAFLIYAALSISNILYWLL